MNRSGLDRLKITVKQIDKYIVNSPIWSDEKIRKQFRPVFKNIFLGLQVKAWCENGNYPVSRQNVVDRYSSDELKTMWNTLHGINIANRQTILDTAAKVRSYITLRHLVKE